MTKYTLNKKELLAQNYLINDLKSGRHKLRKSFEECKYNGSLDAKKLSSIEKILKQWENEKIDKQITIKQLLTQMTEIANLQSGTYTLVPRPALKCLEIVHNLHRSFNQLRKLRAHTLPIQEIHSIIADPLLRWIRAIATTRKFFLNVHYELLNALEQYTTKKEDKNSAYSIAKANAAIGLKRFLDELALINTKTTSTAVEKMIKAVVLCKENLELATQAKNTSNCFFSPAHRGGKIAALFHEDFGTLLQRVQKYKLFLKCKEETLHEPGEEIPLKVLSASV